MGNPRRQNRNRRKSGEKTTSQNGGSNQRKYDPKKAEFKFMLHEPNKKGGYTYDKIFEAITLKIQKEYSGARFVVNSLRRRTRQGPTAPVRDTSNLPDPAAKAIEQETFDRKYEILMAHHIKLQDEFEDNLIRAYGLVYDNYCAKGMQVALKELPDFETRVRDDPLVLLEEVEKLTHVSRKANHPLLALVETLMGWITTRQGEKEGLLSFLERFKSERNVVISLLGDHLIDGYVENTQEYKDIPDGDTTVQERLQNEMKKSALAKFSAILFLKQSQQERYSTLLKEFRQSYANDQRDLFPKDLTSMFDVMRTVEAVKKKNQITIAQKV